MGFNSGFKGLTYYIPVRTSKAVPRIIRAIVVRTRFLVPRRLSIYH